MSTVVSTNSNGDTAKPTKRGVRFSPSVTVQPIVSNTTLLNSSTRAVITKPRRLQYVDHTYRDWSKTPLPSTPEELQAMGRASDRFPAILHQILSYPEYSNIITWMPHGRAIKILKKDMLVSQVLPVFFKGQSKFGSFTRQLSGYGFKRLVQPGSDCNAYYHEEFLMGLPHLATRIQRIPANKGRFKPSSDTEPNFYDIHQTHPLHTLDRVQQPPSTELPLPPVVSTPTELPLPPVASTSIELTLPPVHSTPPGYGYVNGPPPPPYGFPGVYPSTQPHLVQYYSQPAQLFMPAPMAMPVSAPSIGMPVPALPMGMQVLASPMGMPVPASQLGMPVPMMYPLPLQYHADPHAHQMMVQQTHLGGWI